MASRWQEIGLPISINISVEAVCNTWFHEAGIQGPFHESRNHSQFVAPECTVEWWVGHIVCTA
jgi:hypothetical protein